jgi:nicotinamide mononucleotide transporter
MQAALQLFYAAIAVYGWRVWRPQPAGGDSLAIHRWPLAWHGTAAAVIGALTLASGWLLARYTDAALPYLDSFVTWSAVLTTWLVARKLLENWLYWLVIDGVTLGLALDRELYPTAALFALYLVLVVIGWRQWLVTWQRAAGEGP